jgi:hypothetical protein
VAADVEQDLGHGRPRGKPRCSGLGDPLRIMFEQSGRILLDLSRYN